MSKNKKKTVLRIKITMNFKFQNSVGIVAKGTSDPHKNKLEITIFQ